MKINTKTKNIRVKSSKKGSAEYIAELLAMGYSLNVYLGDL